MVCMMGRGRGGYTEKQIWYLDSGGKKVRDRGAISVAEFYMDMGYECVFRKEHPPGKIYDLTIKSNDDSLYIKNIEVKQVASPSISQFAKNIARAFKQLPDYSNCVAALYLKNFKNNEIGLKFAQAGFDEAVRKGYVKGKVEVWFSDKTRIFMN